MNRKNFHESEVSLHCLCSKLQALFDEHQNQRISVVGTFCTGKSTLARKLLNVRDMDDILLPMLTEKETERIFNSVWSEDLGRFVMQIARERILVRPGEPVFATVILECDLVVYLKISDSLLRERTLLRKASFEDAKKLRTQIEEEICQTTLPVVEFFVG